MSEGKKGLSGRQDQQIADLARKALDEGNPNDALDLVSRVVTHRPSALITLMGIAYVQRDDELVCKEALRLFWEQVDKCQKVGGLTGAALWLQHPRGSFLSPGFSQALASRKRQLEPSWNGVWENPGLAGSRVLDENKNKHPRQVHDTEICLILMSQASKWRKWDKRYVELGGDVNSTKYLKIYIANFFKTRHKAPDDVKPKLRKYVEIVQEATARKFLRRLTPKRASLKGQEFNQELAQTAMLIFVSSPRLVLEPEDWLHVVAASIYLEDLDVQRIVLRALAEMERSPGLQSAFEQLVKLHGLPNQSISALDELRSKIYNPIWERIAGLTPVDANARTILFSYSTRRLD